jgi:hypothetical protein
MARISSNHDFQCLLKQFDYNGQQFVPFGTEIHVSE